MVISRTIDDIIEERAKNFPDTIVFQKETIKGYIPVSAETFTKEKRALAAGLAALHLKRGDVVGIIGNPRYEWELSEKAVLSLGAISFGIDTRLSGKEVSEDIESAKINFLIVENRELLETLAREFTGKVVFMEDSVNLRPDQYLLSEIVSNNFGKAPEERPTPGDFAMIISTSGTTGAPKLIEYRHRHIVAAVYAIAKSQNLTPEESSKSKLICWMPLAYMTSKVMNLVSYMVGGQVYFLKDTKKIAVSIKEISPTHFISVPIFYERMFFSIQEEFSKISPLKKLLLRLVIFIRGYLNINVFESLVDSIRKKIVGENLSYMISGSAAISPKLLRFYCALKIPVLEAYALSENAIPMSMNTLRENKIGSVGKPLDANEIVLGKDGEILVRGPGVFEGYMGHFDKNSEIFENGYLKTGDIGSYDLEGFLHITGRKKNIIKTQNGYRISPSEVESVYETSPFIKQICVLGNNQKFIGGLIVINKEKVLSYFVGENKDIKIDSGVINDKSIIDLIKNELDKHSNELAVYKRLKYFTLLSTPFSIEKGELTSNFKLRRAIIEEHYKREINKMFKN